jgi:hypothetical protein
LDLMDARGLRLPDEAQKRIDECDTRVDFHYAEKRVAIFVGGPVRDQPDGAARDPKIEDCLMWTRERDRASSAFGRTLTGWRHADSPAMRLAKSASDSII